MLRPGLHLKLLLVGIAVLMLGVYFTSVQVSGAVIEGYVTDGSTGDPLVSANVYLSETRYGDSSDEKGYFSIKDIPAGNYYFVISYVGYHTFTKEIQIGDGDNRFFEYALEPKEEQLQNIVVKGEVDREWKRNFGRFEKFFIGQSNNADETTIENPEVLTFKTDQSILKAEASEALQIRNESLGYEINLNLALFEWNYIKDHGRTLYFYRFKELTPSDEEEQQKWEANRKTTYKFSPKRFFKSLVAYVNQYGAVEFGKHNLLEDHRYSIGDGYIIAQNAGGSDEGYSLFDNSNKTNVFKIELPFPKDHVKVLIDGEELGMIQLNKEQEPVVKEMYIDQYGNLQNPLDFTLGAVWSKYRVADKLPLNYDFSFD